MSKSKVTEGTISGTMTFLTDALWQAIDSKQDTSASSVNTHTMATSVQVAGEVKKMIKKKGLKKGTRDRLAPTGRAEERISESCARAVVQYSQAETNGFARPLHRK